MGNLTTCSVTCASDCVDLDEKKLHGESISNYHTRDPSFMSSHFEMENFVDIHHVDGMTRIELGDIKLYSVRNLMAKYKLGH